jgi:hypothetical protein
MERWSTTFTSLPMSLHYWTSQRQLFVYVMHTKKKLENSNVKHQKETDSAGRYEPENLNLGYILPILSCLFKNFPITLRGRFRSEVEVQLGLLH